MTTSLLAFSSRKLFRSSKNVSTGCKEQMEVEGGGRGGAGKEDSKSQKKSVRFPYISAFLLGKGTNERQLSRAFPSSVVYTEEGSPKNVPLTKNVLPVKKEGIACCDRCDGKHATDLCPHFPKPRDTSHPDALPSRHRKKLLHNNAFTSSLPGEVYSSSDLLIVRQPGDGSCLFHSLAYGLNDNASSASSLRSLIADFILKNHNYKIAVRLLSSLSPSLMCSLLTINRILLSLIGCDGIRI